MSRFYVTPSNIKGDKIYITKDEAHHVYKVMRLRAEDKVTVFCGTDTEYEGTIKKACPKRVVVKIDKINKVAEKKEFNITLAVSLPKRKKMNLIIQKCTELGVKDIIPVKTERSIVSLDEKRAEKKISRWRTIAKEASKQCGRTTVPDIKQMESFEDILKKKQNYNYNIMPSVKNKDATLASFLKYNKLKLKDKILVLIGPEGGFTDQEIRQAKKEKINVLSLGSRTLRTETACIFAMSVLSFYMENNIK